MYSADNLKDVKNPRLKFGDLKAKRIFKHAYLKYITKHNGEMRKRPREHRVLPMAVVECIDPDLLLYICEHCLENKTSRPERADAMEVHRWVMGIKVSLFGADNDEGLEKLKKLSVTIDGTSGVRNVQTLFIEIRKIRKLYQMGTKPSEIIKWISYNIDPIEVRKVVKGIMSQGNKRARRISKRLNNFHDLLMGIAKVFAESAELGFGHKRKPQKKPTKEPKPRNTKDDSSNAKPTGKGKGAGKKPKKEN